MRLQSPSTLTIAVVVLEDLLAVGIGLDIAGAGLLGYGLISPAREIASRSTSRIEYSAVLAVSQAKDKADAIVGLTLLISGFALQATAYELSLESRPEHSSGLPWAFLPFALAITTSCLAVAAWRYVFRWPILRRVLIDVSKINYLARPPQTMDRPYALLLVWFAEELGLERRQGESPNAFARRVFRI
jgi:hypothetical protein